MLSMFNGRATGATYNSQVLWGISIGTSLDRARLMARMHARGTVCPVQGSVRPVSVHESVLGLSQSSKAKNVGL